MPPKPESAAHIEDSQHEAVLVEAVALAGLFSTCVEAFGLIHPGQKWDKDEQLLLTRLGLQQARLLIWGSVLGVASPPASVTDRAVPKHPSLAYPDLTEPTFFDARDARLDDPQIRTPVEQSLSAIADRSSGHSREEMMSKFGLKPPKKFTPAYEQALDTNRLESWREKYELLREVAESYAHINTRRAHSLIHTSWAISDVSKFGAFIKLIQDKVDFLIGFMDVKDKVDRAMRMDIRMLGWHITFDRAKTATDGSKLRLMQEICREDYPEYAEAIQQALDNINRENRENMMAAYKPAVPASSQTPSQPQKKKPGLLGIIRSFGKHKGEAHHHGRSKSVAGASTLSADDSGPARSASDAGPDSAAMRRTRSKSIGDILEPPEIDEDLRNRLDKMSTKDSGHSPPQEVSPTAVHSEKTVDSHRMPKVSAVPLVPGETQGIVRHDQYHGIARVDTKNLSQPGANFSSGL